ncbi:MAG TPA: hypothetical protein VKG65_11360 [Terriglobales bacterium]|nr:hypothetical protein [Terriglobales bacterium]
MATTQNYRTNKKVWLDGFPLYFNWLSNSAQASDVSPASSSQHYSYFDSTGMFYDCKIASENNSLTSVSRGCQPDKGKD